MDKIKTAEEIWSIACVVSDTRLGQIRVINRLFREQDDSHKWPVNGDFSVVERAIRRLARYQRVYGEMSPLEYALALEYEQSRIVNSLV